MYGKVTFHGDVWSFCILVGYLYIYSQWFKNV